MALSTADADLILTLGLGIAIFAIPSVIAAFADGRAPRAGALGIVVSGAMILWAFLGSPEGYTLERIPDAVARTLARVLNR
ncbi:hypothetical protein [Thioclava atlantica]|nr:hypothetical protein [Thioclava atlantica]